MQTPHANALLLPGQGSQTDEMRDVVRGWAPHLLRILDREIGADAFDRIDQGTRFAQPAIYSASIAYANRWGVLSLGGESSSIACMAGHSLGEITALALAGSLSDEEGLRLVIARGELMQQAADAYPGGMLAILGRARDQVEAIADELGLTVANDNSPDQVVLAGDPEGLEVARERARKRGLRAIQLPVAGAFHSPAMAQARPEFARVLQGFEFEQPRFPVMSCVTARPFDDIPRRLVESLSACVRWREVLGELRGRGISRFFEPGPGSVLTRLVRRTFDDVVAEAGATREVARA